MQYRGETWQGGNAMDYIDCLKEVREHHHVLFHFYRCWLWSRVLYIKTDECSKSVRRKWSPGAHVFINPEVNMFFTTHDDWMKQNSSHSKKIKNPPYTLILHLSSRVFLNLFKSSKVQNITFTQRLKWCILWIISGYKKVYNLCFGYIYWGAVVHHTTFFWIKK